MSAGTSNRDGRPSNPALTTGPPTAWRFPRSLPSLRLGPQNLLGGLSHGATAPVGPLYSPSAANPTSGLGSQHRHVATAASCWNTSLRFGCYELSFSLYSMACDGAGATTGVTAVSRGAAPTRRPSPLFHSPARPTLAMGLEGCSPNIACQRRASSALGTPSCNTSCRCPSPVPNASTADTFPIYSTAE